MENLEKHSGSEETSPDVLYRFLFTFFIFCALLSVCFLTIYA